MLDMTSRYHQLFILGGCYGRRVDITPLAQTKNGELKKLKQDLDEIANSIAKQRSILNQMTNDQDEEYHQNMRASITSFQETPLTKIDQNLTQEHQQIVDVIASKTENLEQQLLSANDYLIDIDAKLDSWQSKASYQTFSVVENIEEEDQEWYVRELITIDRSIGKLVLLIEKMDLLIEKNNRVINRAQLKIKSDQLQSSTE